MLEPYFSTPATSLPREPRADSIGGRRLGDAFRVIEALHEPDPHLVRGLCAGRGPVPAVALVVRRAVPTDVIRAFAHNFWHAVESVGSHRSDDGYVRVQQIGATQFCKSGAEYAEQCARTRISVEALFEGLSADERARVLGDRWLVPSLAQAGLSFRPARILGVDVAPCTARWWRNEGAFSLEPHEDRAQVLGALEEGLEIGAAEPLCAWVCCVENAGGGELVIWDVAPDHGARERFGVVKTGYPYPADALHGVPMLKVPLDAGDAVLFRADFMHAIGNVDGPRISVSRFLGAIDDSVVFWT